MALAVISFLIVLFSQVSFAGEVTVSYLIYGSSFPIVAKNNFSITRLKDYGKAVSDQPNLNTHITRSQNNPNLYILKITTDTDSPIFKYLSNNGFIKMLQTEEVYYEINSKGKREKKVKRTQYIKLPDDFYQIAPVDIKK